MLAGGRNIKKGKPPANAVPHAEDSQPNESIARQRAVPNLVVLSSKQHQQFPHFNRGFRGQGRGRGRGGYNAPGHAANKPFPRGSVNNSAPPSFPRSQTAASQPQRAPFRAPDAPRVHAIRRDPEAAAARSNSVYETPLRVSDTKLSKSASKAKASNHISSPTASFTTSSRPQNAHRRQAIPHDPRGGVAAQPNSGYGRRGHVSALELGTTASTTSSVSHRSAYPIPPSTVPPVLYLSSPPPPPIASRTLNSPPPSKRRRVDVVKIEPEEPPIHSIHPPTPPFPPPTQIKEEPRTPSPSPPPQRRSAMSGSKRYWPVPAACNQIFNPEGYKNERQRWLRREHAVLKKLGLKVVKYFFRDDGMVLEWESQMPVWLDTLKPVRPKTPEIIDLDPDPSDAEPPLFRTPSPSPVAGPSNSSNAHTHDPPVADSPVAFPAEDTVERPWSDIDAEYKQLSRQFLHRYLNTFDTDRDALSQAYSDDAVFSFRNNDFASLVHFTVVGRSRYPGKIPDLSALQKYRFVPRNGVLEVDYDTVVEPRTPDSDTLAVVSVHGHLVSTIDERAQMAIDQAFVLRKPAGAGIGDNTASSSRNAIANEPWPLVVSSHQMTVRDTPWVRWTGSLSDFVSS
ncbi:hypothetical protein R3P38DRAFT_2875782 [Favolaschia claudopus]|uniref:NTF2 domain-containing protein n=1 Tax=Favolaschia claudopus TaxID=2862362 RepID=A0AAW0D6R0_9AGAR